MLCYYEYVNQLQCCSNCGGGLFGDAGIRKWISNFESKRASQDTSQTRTNDASQSKVQFPSNISFFGVDLIIRRQ